MAKVTVNSAINIIESLNDKFNLTTLDDNTLIELSKATDSLKNRIDSIIYERANEQQCTCGNCGSDKVIEFTNADKERLANTPLKDVVDMIESRLHFQTNEEGVMIKGKLDTEQLLTIVLKNPTELYPALRNLSGDHKIALSHMIHDKFKGRNSNLSILTLVHKMFTTTNYTV